MLSSCNVKLSMVIQRFADHCFSVAIYVLHKLFWKRGNLTDSFCSPIQLYVLRPVCLCVCVSVFFFTLQKNLFFYCFSAHSSSTSFSPTVCGVISRRCWWWRGLLTVEVGRMWGVFHKKKCLPISNKSTSYLS